jgi:mannitol-specific phosphotransferase system IIBC component
MIALYFTVFPKEAKIFITEAQEYEKEEKKREQEEYEEIERYVNSLSKQELREALKSYFMVFLTR